MARIVNDSFDRANSTTTLGNADSGQTWTAPVGTWGISSNQAYSASAASGDTALIDCGISNQRVEADVTGSSSFPCEILVRASSENDSYYFKHFGTIGTSAGRRVGGVVTQLLNFGSAGNPSTENLVLSAEGPSIRIWQRGTFTASGSFVDTALTVGTKAGLKVDQAGAGALWDNFSVSTIPRSGAQVDVRPYGRGAYGLRMPPVTYPRSTFAGNIVLTPYARGKYALREITLQGNAGAGLASGTGAANNAAGSVAPNAGNAAGTGAANDAALSVKPGAGNAAGTGSAGNAAGAVQGTSGAATGTGAAGAPAGSIAPSAGNAAGTGTAYDATVKVSSSAGVATGTGSAGNAAGSVAGTSGVATGAGSAGDPAGAISASAGLAAGTGTASNAMDSESASAIIATGTGQAFDATVAISTHAGVATGTGTAYDAAPTTSATVVATETSTPGSGPKYFSGRTGPGSRPIVEIIAIDDEDLLLLV